MPLANPQLTASPAKTGGTGKRIRFGWVMRQGCGPKYHIDGVGQLLGYMTGRELRGLMVVYMRKANGSVLMKKVRNTMDGDKPENQQGITTSHPLKWAFDSSHLHTCGDTVRISHVACNLYIDGT